MAAIKIKQGEDWVKLPNVGIQSGIADAPVDDKQYVRSNGKWNELVIPESGISDAESDNIIYARRNAEWIEVPIQDRAPRDTTYGMMGEEWVPVVPEAEVDDRIYARRNAEWIEVEIPEYELPVATSDTLGGIQVGYLPTANTFAVQLDASNNAYVRIPFAEESSGLMTEEQFNKVDRLRNYITSTTVASLNVNYENIYVTLSANASLSASATGTDYDGRSVTAYVYTDASYTITIPTTGNYVSMCGSSFTTVAGGWVEFNLTCINGIWHIAKLEQE